MENGDKPVTVAEMIAQLQQFPPDAIVGVSLMDSEYEHRDDISGGIPSLELGTGEEGELRADRVQITYMAFYAEDETPFFVPEE